MLDLRTSALSIAVVLASFAAACTKTESTSSTSGTAPSTSTSTTTPATASAPSATPTESVTAADTASAPPTTASAGTATATKDGGATAATSGSAGGAVACGTKPLPDCPLQAWMKANANPPMLANDLPGLATALDKIVALAPAGYPNWASIAKDGAKAAKDGDMTAVKASCRTCHDQYKDKYKKESRARKI